MARSLAQGNRLDKKLVNRMRCGSLFALIRLNRWFSNFAKGLKMKKLIAALIAGLFAATAFAADAPASASAPAASTPAASAPAKAKKAKKAKKTDASAPASASAAAPAASK
jgi:hypothetical protein